jgi:hypothetical protein
MNLVSFVGEGPFSLVRFFLLAPMALALRAGFAVRRRFAPAVGQQKEMNQAAERAEAVAFFFR